MDYIKLVKNRRIPLLDTPPEKDKDYLLAIRLSNTGRTQVDNSKEESDTTYEMGVINIESFQEIGCSPKKLGETFTPSQKLRFAIQEYFNRLDGFNEEKYEREIEKLTKLYKNRELS